MPAIKQILEWLIFGSKGGETRKRILLLLKKKPLNANALTKEMEMDYKTIQHHLNVLKENQLVNTIRNNYGKVFFISVELDDQFDLFKKMIGGDD